MVLQRSHLWRNLELKTPTCVLTLSSESDAVDELVDGTNEFVDVQTTHGPHAWEEVGEDGGGDGLQGPIIFDLFLSGRPQSQPA